MQIYVARGEELLGPYSEDQAREHLRQGLLASHDWAGLEGDPEWRSLFSVLESLRHKARRRALSSPKAEKLNLWVREEIWKSYFTEGGLGSFDFKKPSIGKLRAVLASLDCDDPGWDLVRTRDAQQHQRGRVCTKLAQMYPELRRGAEFQVKKRLMLGV